MKAKIKEGKVKSDIKDWEGPDNKVLQDLMEEFDIALEREDEDEEGEEKEEEPEKMFFGSKADNYFYLVTEGDDPKDFIILSAEGEEVFRSGVDNISINDFVYKAVTDLDLDSISWDVISKYNLLGLQEEGSKEEEEESEIGEEEELPEE